MIFVSGYKDELKTYVEENKELLEGFSNKKILVTGAAGLIGSYLTDLIITADEIFDINCHVYAVDKDKKLLKSRFPDSYSDFVTCLDIDVNEKYR